ncbi:IS481 family transposase [Nonomuraea sp. LP-02]|uniref:IS481 family transposase n=1 Tax=Nonomuraea sp. LP-02 TaxID=3097960 RepID=UPI002E2EADB2|nr:IS481 family transposase [Nonomuraea sp. LP-02]MED7929881.1 IS481 family transposase [Nonomuraea sp. LP-02]
MSKARVVITAVVVEGRSQAEVARAYGVSKGWVSKLVARYRAEGEAAFEPRSRRPRTSPNAIDAGTVELIVRLRKELAEQGLDAGPDTIAWHLAHHHGRTVSRATISRYLTRRGLVVPEPKKRPRSSYIRFQAALPNETWQADFTHYRLAGGSDAEILSWLDDHSRYALSVTAHARVTGPIVRDTFRHAVKVHGVPASTLTDNGMVFTTRLAGGRGGRNAFEHELRRLHVRQKNSAPNHPTTCGKVERFQQTMKNWLRAQPGQPATLAGLQALLDRFCDAYNHHRPHRSLPHRATPAATYAASPKALPDGGRDTDTHARVRHDRIDPSGVVTLRVNGRLHHIGIGRTHARTHVILLIDDLHIRVANAVTGELLRELILDPARDYQPQVNPNKTKPPNP